jgi:hypothetical protein
MVIFHSYVSLPEGSLQSTMKMLWKCPLALGFPVELPGNMIHSGFSTSMLLESSNLSGKKKKREYLWYPMVSHGIPIFHGLLVRKKYE